MVLTWISILGCYGFFCRCIMVLMWIIILGCYGFFCQCIMGVTVSSGTYMYKYTWVLWFLMVFKYTWVLWCLLVLM